MATTLQLRVSPLKVSQSCIHKGAIFNTRRHWRCCRADALSKPALAMMTIKKGRPGFYAEGLRPRGPLGGRSSALLKHIGEALSETTKEKAEGSHRHYRGFHITFDEQVPKFVRNFRSSQWTWQFDYIVLSCQWSRELRSEVGKFNSNFRTKLRTFWPYCCPNFRWIWKIRCRLLWIKLDQKPKSFFKILAVNEFTSTLPWSIRTMVEYVYKRSSANAETFTNVTTRIADEITLPTWAFSFAK